MVGKLNLAMSLTRSGRRHEEAVAAYEQSSTIAQQFFGPDGWSHGAGSAAKYHMAMAYSLREVGREKDAEEALGRGMHLLGNDASAYYMLARYEARGAERLARSGGDARVVEALTLRALATLQARWPRASRGFRACASSERRFSSATGPRFSSSCSTRRFPPIRCARRVNGTTD